MSKKFVIATMASVFLLLSLVSTLVVIVDPYFHYHEPLANFEYRFGSNRYINNGILRNYNYDAVIIGSSMTENFKTSECESLFACKAVKVPYPGATYKEISNQLKLGLSVNPDVKMVIRSLDIYALFQEKDAMRYDSYPDYLYDENILNDVNYTLNKDVLIEGVINDVIKYTGNGNKTTTFDEYSNWMDGKTFGPKAALSQYNRQDKCTTEQKILSEEGRLLLRGSIEQNVISLIVQYPDIEWYIFFPPVSILKFDEMNQSEALNKYLGAMESVIEMLLPYDNVHMFSFFNNYEMICNLDNYKDPEHHGDWINSQILVWMKNDEYRLNQDNYKEYCKSVKEFYLNYDYDALF